MWLNDDTHSAFEVTRQAFVHALGFAGLRRPLQLHLASLQRDDRDHFEAGSAHMRSLVRGITLPVALRLAIANAYTKLGAQALVSVSARREDAPDVEHVLHVQGLDVVLHAIVECWASAYDPASLETRRTTHQSDAPKLAVIIRRELGTAG